MREPSGQRGATLIIALLVTAAMTAIIVEIISVVNGQADRTTAFIEGKKAAVVAEDGVELAKRYLGTLPGGYTYLDKGFFAAPVDGITLEVSVEDESGKVQANSVVFANGEANEAVYSSCEALMPAASLQPALCEPLADWLDADDMARSNGAEGRFYSSLPVPYAAKNGKLDTLGEIALVKGFDAQAASRLTRYFTVYSDGLVNINTAPKEVLMALSGEITPEMAEKLIERRNAKPFANASDIREVKGFETLVFSLQGRIKVKSDIFRVRTRAMSGGVAREVEAVVRIGKPGKVLYWRAR
ncbi:MAG: type II secretion system minor pseudopilin GspK [Deltaproteobacteria bacterium]|nr:type II secretion system minor pseudopilin GspK [Deltaproteobacteria bacterium]